MQNGACIFKSEALNLYNLFIFCISFFIDLPGQMILGFYFCYPWQWSMAGLTPVMTATLTTMTKPWAPTGPGCSCNSDHEMNFLGTQQAHSYQIDFANDRLLRT